MTVQGFEQAPVTLVRWPDDAGRVDTLGRTGRPCLLLVDGGAPPPAGVTGVVDWVRLPARHGDIAARIDMLRRRAGWATEVVPSLDADGLLRRGTALVVLSPLESALLRVLLDWRGEVVHRQQLAAAWPGCGPARARAIDGRMTSLRRRIGRLGMDVRAVRGRGYVLDVRPWTRRG